MIDIPDNLSNMIDIQDNPAAFAATLPRVLTYCYLPANAINTLLFPNNLRLIVVMMMMHAINGLDSASAPFCTPITSARHIYI